MEMRRLARSGGGHTRYLSQPSSRSLSFQRGGVRHERHLVRRTRKHGVHHTAGLVSDRLVPLVVRGCVSGIPLGAASAPSATTATGGRKTSRSYRDHSGDVVDRWPPRGPSIFESTMG
jgi:hypothetical protein